MRLRRPRCSHQEYDAIATFSKWLLDVGNGTIGEPDENDTDNSSWIQIPDKYCIAESHKAMQELISFIYDEETLQRPTATLLHKKP